MPWPTEFDFFPGPAPTDLRSATPSLSSRLDTHGNALEALQLELGLTPSDTFADVAERLADMESRIEQEHVVMVREQDGSPEVEGVHTLEFGSSTVTDQGAGVARIVPNLVSGSAGWAGATEVVAANDASQSTKDAVAAAGGRVCDGTGDQNEINAAINDLPAVGGMVLLSEGNFIISNEVALTRQGVTLAGMGMGSPKFGGSGDSPHSRLLAASGISGQILRVSNAANTNRTSWITLRDFSIDGQNLGSGVDAILFRAFWSRCYRVQVSNASGDGWRLLGGVNAGENLFDTTFMDLLISGCGGWGINSEALSGDTQMTNIVIKACGAGGAFGGGSQQWMGNHFYSNGGYGFHVKSAGARTKLIGTKIEHNGPGGVLWEGSQGIMMGCSVQGNGNAGDNAVRFIGDGNLIGHCQIRQETGDSSASATVGLRFDSGADNNLVSGCIFDGFTTKLSNVGASNKAHGNLGVADFG